MMPRISQLLAVLILGLTCIASHAQAQGAKRPNILFIMADGQAEWARGNARLHPNAVTPELDRLALEGATFKNFFSSTPACSPARASIMTSRYGSELGINDWLKSRSKDPDHPDARRGLDPYIPNLANVMTKAGYRTGLCGKWHLGESPAFHPLRVGFQYFGGFRGGGTSPEDPVLEVAEIDEPLYGLTCDIITDLALQFLIHQRETHPDQPFFLALNFRAPHPKWLPVAEEDWEPFENMKKKDLVRLPNADYPELDTERAKQMTLEYLASVRCIDRNLGRIMMELEDQNYTKDTLVIYTSDHGYNMGHHGLWRDGSGLSLLKSNAAGTVNVPGAQEPNLYDTSIRVPALVRWPAVIHADAALKPGSVIDETGSHLDWLPTFRDLGEIRLPIGTQLRGRSLLPLIKGQASPRKDEFFGQYTSTHYSRSVMRCYRSSKFKLVRDYLNPERDQFFDLKADPRELDNLLGKLTPLQQKVVDQFDSYLLLKMEEIGDPALEMAEKRAAAPAP